MPTSLSPKETKTESKPAGSAVDYLRLSEKRYQAMVDSQSDLVYRYHADGTITFVNRAACAFFGRAREELLGVQILAFIPPEHQGVFCAHMEEQAANPRLELRDYPVVTPGGHLRWLQVTDHPLLNAEGGVVEFQAVARDITERKLAERHDHEMDARYRALVEDSPALLCRFNPEGRLTYVNGTFCEFMGYPREEILGKSILSVMTPRTVSGEWARLSRLQPGMPGGVYELEMAQADGSRRWCRWTIRAILEEKGGSREFQAAGIDITARKHAEDALAGTELRYRQFLEKMHLLAVQLDLDWKIIFCNDFFLDLTGYHRDEVLGKNWLDLIIHPEHRELAQARLMNVKEHGQMTPYAQSAILTQQGEKRLIAWNNSLMRDADGGVIGITGLGEDVTDRVWAEKIQEITLRISQGAASAHTIDELYTLIHTSLAEVMPVENFFISLYDRDRDELSFPYYVDEYDPPPQPQKLDTGLTEYVLRTGKPLFASPEVFEKLVARGDVILVGAPSVDWLGVPLNIGERTIGVMVAQSYTEGVRFSQRDLQIMDFVSTQVAMTIERKRAEHDLRESEEKYRALVESSSSAIFLESDDGRILECNNAASELLGYSREEFLQIQVSTLIPDNVRDSQPDLLQKCMTLPFNRVESYNRHKDGTLVPVEVSTRRISVGGEALTVVYLDDISERKRRTREMETIAGVSAALRTAITQTSILPVILQQLVDRLKVHGAFIALTDPGGWNGRVELGCGTWAGLSGSILPADSNLCNQVYRTGNMYVNNDAFEDAAFPFPDWIDGVHAVACVPLITQGLTLGSLTVGYERPILAEELDILIAISDISASAIQRALLYEQTSRQAEELTAAYDATIEGWALALELRDKETQGHSRRVTEMSLRLATALGLSEIELEHIRRGVLLHDIGKMGIPDSILLKPGPLTEDEWLIMRKHPEYAYKMLSSIAYLKPALDIPYCHHEKWDGSGYPRCLRGEQIPLYARLFAVVDVLDALTSERPYRPAWSQAESLEYIRKQSGRQFDPTIVDVFLGLQA